MTSSSSSSSFIIRLRECRKAERRKTKTMQERSWQEFQKMGKALKKEDKFRSCQTMITEKRSSRCQICRSRHRRSGETRANRPSSMLQMKVSCPRTSRASPARATQPRIDSSPRSITEPTVTLASNQTWPAGISKGQFPLRISSLASSLTFCSRRGWPRPKLWRKRRGTCKC